MHKKLQDIFEKKSWAGTEKEYPRSGSGSSLQLTGSLRSALPAVLKRYKVKTFLDAPCGDWTWMQEVDLSGVHYIGADISLEIVENVKTRYAAKDREFMHLDITTDPLPKADFMLCRECLFHLKFWLRWSFFANFVNSEIPFLFTTKDAVTENKNLRVNGSWFPFNPCIEPFNFAPPIYEIRENRRRRSMGVWSREQIIDALRRHEQDTKTVGLNDV